MMSHWPKHEIVGLWINDTWMVEVVSKADNSLGKGFIKV